MDETEANSHIHQLPITLLFPSNCYDFLTSKSSTMKIPRQLSLGRLQSDMAQIELWRAASPKHGTSAASVQKDHHVK